jgi:hypothetical protein
MSIFNIGDIIESVGELIYDEAILAEIKVALQAAADDLETGKHLPNPPPASYGASPAAGDLAGNAALAREVVMDAITDMALGLQGYRTVVDDFHTRTEDVTATSVADSHQIAVATECVGGNHFREPARCELPSGTGSDA